MRRMTGSTVHKESQIPLTCHRQQSCLAISEPQLHSISGTFTNAENGPTVWEGYAVCLEDSDTNCETFVQLL